MRFMIVKLYLKYKDKLIAYLGGICVVLCVFLNVQLNGLEKMIHIG
jgi:hypothetical protein